MTVVVRALASGSSGNAFVVQSDRAGVLLDAGYSASRLQALLLTAGVRPSELRAVVLTHEHHDHASGARALSRRLGIPLYATPGTAAALAIPSDEYVALGHGRRVQVEDVEISAFAVAHDAGEPVGLLLEAEGTRVALATDVGAVDERLIDWVSVAELLIVDTNHDLQRLWNGPYPTSLKRRIASPLGHLSNGEAAHCIGQAAERGSVRWAWLAHLSEVNNSHRAALRAAAERVRGSTLAIDVVRRDRPSLVWRSDQRYLQGSLF